MGNSQSSSKLNEPAVEKLLVQQLEALRTRDAIHQREVEHEYIQVESEKGIPRSFSTDPSFDTKTASEWEKELLSDPKNRFALNALLSNNIRDVVSNKIHTLPDTQTFNVKIPFEGSPVTNQRSSGRCWLFATTNVLRVPVMKKYNLKEFELSQAYLFFWDKIEKANWFLEQMVDTADKDLDERIVQELLGAPVNDGGQWDMASNLVEKYGLVRIRSSHCIARLWSLTEVQSAGPSNTLPRQLQCHELECNGLHSDHQTPRRRPRPSCPRPKRRRSSLLCQALFSNRHRQSKDDA